MTSQRLSDIETSLSARLAAATTPAEWQEVWLKEWDEWRAYIAKGGDGSWPRDCFESLLDNWQEDRDTLARQVLSLTEEMLAWRIAMQRLTPGGSEYMTPRACEEWAEFLKRQTVEAKLDRAREFKRADKAEADAKALRERLGDIRGICLVHADDPAAVLTYKQTFKRIAALAEEKK